MVDTVSPPPLAPRAPLESGRGRTTLRDVTDLALVTIALPDDTARNRLAAAFAVALPAVGSSVVTGRDERLLGLQHDRLFVLFAADRDADPEALLRERLAGPDATGTDDARDTAPGENGAHARTLLYSSDQSDAWAMLRLDGPDSRRVLERLCPLDLHPDSFPEGAVARSLVEHLGVIVLREAQNAFLLLSPRSSARDFLHEIEITLSHLGDSP